MLLRYNTKNYNFKVHAQNDDCSKDQQSLSAIRIICMQAIKNNQMLDSFVNCSVNTFVYVSIFRETKTLTSSGLHLNEAIKISEYNLLEARH